MLKDFIPVKKGDVVIQNGANSAVGQCVIQMCRAEGIQSVNIVRNRPDIDQLKQELQALGADYVLTEEELRYTYCILDVPRYVYFVQFEPTILYLLLTERQPYSRARQCQNLNSA
jgi:hypothetical protein